MFELLVRSWLCDSGKLTTKQLHRATVSYVCAPAQAARVDRMLPLLTPDELAQYKRCLLYTSHWRAMRACIRIMWKLPAMALRQTVWTV